MMAETKKLEGKRILMVVAKKNFRDEEYFIPFEIFQREGAKVTTASSVKGEVTGVEGGEAKSTITPREVNPKDFDAIVFAGGDGAREYFGDEEVHKLIREFYSRKKIVAAICIAPVILAKAGVLKSKKATVWSSFANKSAIKDIKDGGAVFCDKGVVVFSNLVTANGPAQAETFAGAVAEALMAPVEEDKK